MDNDLGLDELDPSNLILANRRSVMGEGVTSLGDDPQKVGRAYELARATGDKPALVYSNLDNYEEQHKATLTAQLLSSSDHLRQYIEADPMHAKLSNDDWASLDGISEKLSRFRNYLHDDTPLGLPTRHDGVLDAMMRGFTDTLRESQGHLPHVKDSELRDYPFATAVLQAARAPFDVMMGGMKAITEGVKAGIEGAGGSPQLARDLAGVVELQLQGQGVHAPKPTAKGVAEGAMDFWERNPEYRKAAEQAYKAAQDTKLWLDNGKEPPAGLNKDIDKLKLDQNNADIKHLDEMVRDAQSSATRERDPETFARFIRMRDEGSISIDGEAVAKLYGDKVPEVEDGLLGWHDGLAGQLETARATGADVEVPFADFLARIDPEVYKLLKDDIRIRPGGITKNEAKFAQGGEEVVNAAREEKISDAVAKAREDFEANGPGSNRAIDRARALEESMGAESSAEYSKEYDRLTDEAVKEYLRNKRNREILPEDLPQMRAHAGLEPLFSIGDRKLKIEKRPVEMKGDAFGADQWRLLDENGQKVGHLEITAHGQNLYVDNVLGLGKFGVRDFGPALMRDLLRQIKEAYPNATKIGGFRISGAREKAGTEKEVWINLDNPSGWTIDTSNEFRRILDGADGGKWETYSPRMEAYIRPREGRSVEDRAMIEAVMDEMDRIVPKQVSIQEADRIKASGAAGNNRAIEPSGAYINYKETYPTILWALEGVDPLGTNHHEAIHHLRRYGFFEGSEWSTLERAARDEGWIEKFGIERRYPHADTPLKLEEAIADGFKTWMREPEAVSEKLHPIFQKLKDLFDAIKAAIAKVIGKEPTWEDIFQKVDKGEVGNREGDKPLDPQAFTEKLSAPEEVPQDQRSLFATPATIGMTQKQQRLYERALRDMQESDQAHSQAIAEKEQKKRLTAEWKTERKNVRAEVEADMNNRPDVAADLFFARGELYGEKLGERYKIDYDDLTAEQRAQLPKDYVGKKGQGGVELEDVASLVGYPDAKAMIEHLVAYNKAKLEANMSAKAFRDRMVDIETDRQMAGRYGKLEENILDAVKDQVTSETQLNLIGEEVLALGIRNKGEATINKGEIRAWVQDQFAESPVAGQSSDKYLKAAGKKGTAAEIALLQDKIDAAYREKQGQYIAMSLAKEARGLEKEQKQFAKLSTKLEKRKVAGLNQEYHDVIQMLQWQAGQSPKRSMLEIQSSQVKSGFTSLDSFVEAAKSDGYVLDITDDIIAGRVKNIKDMTVAEFREYHNTLKTLNYAGRKVEKIEIEGREQDFNALRQEGIADLKQRPVRDYESQTAGLYHLLYGFDAIITKAEGLFAAFDYGKEMGMFIRNIAVPLASSKHKKYTMQEQLGRDIKALNASLPKEFQKSLNEVLPNDWLKDPLMGNYFKMTRSNLINIMLNMGNRSNIRKLANYGSPDATRGATKAEAAEFRTKMVDYINEHATDADIKYVNGIWAIYEGYKDDIETVWRNTSGTQPRLFEPEPLDLDRGRLNGGYVPLLRDLFQPATKVKEVHTKGPFDANYPNFNTPQGHLKERTGATYYIDFRQPLQQISVRMQQTIHDIAYRAEVMTAAKILRDGEIRNAIRNHYGREYEKTLDSWLNKTAKGASLDENGLGVVNDILRKVRLNLIQYALPFNPNVMFTPDVGNFNLKALGNYWKDWQTNSDLARTHSKEIPHAIYNMDRDFNEAMQRLVGEGKMDATKTKVARWGYSIATSITQQFRSAVFIDGFNEAKMRGKADAEAAEIADAVVRDQFGSTAIHDLPAVMTSGEPGRLLTMFYGYGSNQFNRMRPIPDHIRRGEYMDALARGYGAILVGAMFGAFIANPAKKEDSYLKRMAKAIPIQVLSMMPFAREAGTMFFDGITPRTPFGSVAQSVQAAANDTMDWMQGKKPKKPVQHIINAASLVTGFPGGLEAGRSLQGVADVKSGVQHPRDFTEWVRLLLYGEAQLKSKGQR